MRESDLLAAIRLAVMRQGLAVVTRNNTGVDIERGIRYGLGRGGADLVGFIRGSGRVLAIEVKTERGRIRPEQHFWLGALRKGGGAACVCRSVEEALAFVRRAAEGASE